MYSKCHEMGAQNKTLYTAYTSIYENYHDLEERCAALSADLEEQRSLVRALEIQNQRASEEAATAQDWKAQELQVRDDIIKELEEKIDYNETTLREIKESMDDLINKLDKIETQRDELETEKDTLAIKHKKATLHIDHLEKDRLELAELHTQTVKRLESENRELQATLGEVKTELLSRWPNMHDNLDNIKQVLGDDGDIRKSKKPKGKA
jgi:chromosome segregation ATPase